MKPEQVEIMMKMNKLWKTQPLDNISAVEFSGNGSIYDSYLETSASSTGINSRLLYSKDRQNRIIS